MLITRKILKWSAIILVLIALQTLTYFTLGQRQLKKKLLPEYFAELASNSDSVFVRDFYIADCYTGNANTYLSLNLSNDKEFIQEKFNVGYVYFDNQEHFNWSDTTENRFNLIYNTWAAREGWNTLFGLYRIQQTETLQTHQRYLYKREVTYRWFLFFWIPTFEWFESTDINVASE